MVTHSKLILAAMTAALVVSGSASQAAGPTTTGPARLDLTAYPYLPGTDVRMTRAADYAALLQEQAA